MAKLKLVSSALGTVALYGPGDEVLPEGGLLQRDLVKFVGDAYQFSIRPEIPPGVPPQLFPTLSFQQGKLEGKEIYPIHQMLLMQNGDAVSAQTTDAADFILSDLIKQLEHGLHYRYGDISGRRKTYFSAIIVQFDAALEDRISAFGRIEKILNRVIPRENMPFKPKILSFGHGDPAIQGIANVDDLLKADFSLQRRVGAPYSENRYFSSAPLSTTEHAELLQEIETAFAD